MITIAAGGVFGGLVLFLCMSLASVLGLPMRAWVGIFLGLMFSGLICSLGVQP